MLKKAIVLGTFLMVGVAGAADPVSSGPQAGDKVPGPFKPMNVTGPDAGKEAANSPTQELTPTGNKTIEVPTNSPF